MTKRIRIGAISNTPIKRRRDRLRKARLSVLFLLLAAGHACLAQDATAGNSSDDINYQNAPLGMSLPNLQKKFPGVAYCPNANVEDEDSAVPLAGYQPVINDALTPEVDGQGFMHLDGSILRIYSAVCPSSDTRTSPLFFIFNGMVLAVTKKTTDDADGTIQDAATRLSSSLPFSKKGTFEVSGILIRYPETLVYSESEDKRVILLIDDWAKSLCAQFPTMNDCSPPKLGLTIGYVDLSLWNSYSQQVRARISKVLGQKQKEGDSVAKKI